MPALRPLFPLAVAGLIAALATCSLSSKAAPIATPVLPEKPDAVIKRLMEERPLDEDSKWLTFDGCPRVPEYPAMMLGVGSHLYVATADRIEVFDTNAKTWAQEPIALPERIELGVAFASNHKDKLYLLRGGKHKTGWQVALPDGGVTALPETPEEIARGGAMTFMEGDLYITTGGRREDFYILREGATEWEDFGRLGGKSPMNMGFGRTCGFLANAGPAIYAFPNHHIHRYDGITKEWRPGNWVAMKFLPCLNGGGVAADPMSTSVYSTAGFYSRSLVEIVPSRKESFSLKPRLPYPMIGEGDRLSIASIGGVPHLFAYAIAPDNKLCAIPWNQLSHITRKQDAADEGSPWHVFGAYGGGNGVRHWTTKGWSTEPGPMSNASRSAGTIGVMGALDGELFTMRRAFTRRLDPVSGIFGFYPGFSLGKPLSLGAAGIFDGNKSIYFITGRSDYFVRREVPDELPFRKKPEDVLPANKTDMDVLATLPFDVGRSASLAYLNGMVYAARGGATRDFARYDVATNEWQALPSLPDAATAIGEQGGGIVAAAGAVFALSADQAWRFDVAEAAWSRLGSMDFAMSWDGGMYCTDGEQYVYVTRGGISMRLGRLDLATGDFQELLPRPPDVISTDGNRMAVITVEGQERLMIHRGTNSNEIFWIETDKFDPAADL